MSFTNLVKKVVCVAVIGLGLLGGMVGSANACEAGYRQVWVTRYETHDVAYRVRVVNYDHCGTPYVTYTTAYRTVEVPVQKLVTVAY